MVDEPGVEKTDEEKAIERERAERKAAFAKINSRPDNFRWNIKGTILDKTKIFEHIAKKESEIGKYIIEELKKISVLLPEAYPLGKRAVCLICGTELLTTKTGNGILACCGQNMEIKEAQNIPSSD